MNTKAHEDPDHSGSPRPPGVFLAFVREARPWLNAFLFSRGVNAVDIDDIAQDCMERLVRYRGCEADELFLLLNRIARNRMVDIRRSPRAQMECNRMQLNENIEDDRSIADPLRQAIARQELRILIKSLLTLSMRSREVYLLNRVVGMSYVQIARHRGVTPKTVEKQMSRALRDLRKALDAVAM
ncbi:MAG: RNA polymerase sigma factor [Stenotrophomonas geniculata]